MCIRWIAPHESHDFFKYKLKLIANFKCHAPDIFQRNYLHNRNSNQNSNPIRSKQIAELLARYSRMELNFTIANCASSALHHTISSNIVVVVVVVVTYFKLIQFYNFDSHPLELRIDPSLAVENVPIQPVIFNRYNCLSMAFLLNLFYFFFSK